MLVLNNKSIATDESGYLKDWQDWSPELIAVLANQESIELTESHLEVVYFVRDFYLEYKTSPAIRALVKAMEKNLDQKKVTVVIYIDYFLKVLRNKQQNLLVYQNQLSVYRCGLNVLAKWKLPILLLIILAYLQYALWCGKNNVFDYRQNRTTVQLMQVENDKLKLRNEQMFAEISNLYDGSDAIEERSRYHLGMIKPDEHFYRIVSDSSSQLRD